MNASASPQGTVTAALLVIGDEILSGRTADKNIVFIAERLSREGIALREVRVVADDQADIVAAVNALRERYRYVFTTGGIGPTHDDITTDAIGKAFGVAVAEDPRAVAALEARNPGVPLTEARRRMARMPQGAEPVENVVSAAPGYMLENVIVMAGIPRIMQAMLDRVLPKLEKGWPFLSRSVRIDAPESEVAPGLGVLQSVYKDVQIGSYPFFEESGVGTYIVLRATAQDRLEDALKGLWRLIEEQGFHAVKADAADKS